MAEAGNLLHLDDHEASTGGISALEIDVGLIVRDIETSDFGLGRAHQRSTAKQRE